MTDSFSRWMEIAGKTGLRLAVILVFAILLTRMLKAVTARLVHLAKSSSRAGQMREQQTRTLAGLLYSIGAAVIGLIAALMAFEVLGFDIAPAIAFGAQSLLKDFINGFFIVFEDQYVVGDLIQVNGETGRVEHLTLRRTVIRNPAGAMVTMPNSLVGQVANLSRDWSQAFVDVTVPAAEVVGRALATLEKIAGDFRNDADWSAALIDGPRVLGSEALSLDRTVIRRQARTILNRKEDVARELRRRIKLGFEQAKIPLSHTHQIVVQGDVAQSDE